MNIPRFSLEFPRMLRRTLPVSFSYTATSTATQFTTGATDGVYRLNDIYSPAGGGSTHQPYGMDQIEGIYGKYQVISARVTLDIQAYGASNQIAVLFGTKDSSTSANTQSALISNMAERPNNTIIFATYESPRKWVSGKLDIATIEGIRPSQFFGDITDYCALTSASPGKIVSFTLNAANMTSAAAATIVMLVTIEYDVVFTEPVTVGASSHV